MAFCKATFIGNLGRDVESRFTPGGKQVHEFSVAVNQSRRDPQTGEWSDETDWFRCTVWGDYAKDTIEKLRKGDRVFVEGRFRTREYEGKDGRMRTSLEVTADTVIALGEKPKSSAAPADEDLDDLPF